MYATSNRNQVKPNAFTESMTLGFTAFLRVYHALLDFEGIWNTAIALLNTVQPNLRKTHRTKLTPMVWFQTAPCVSI